MKIHCDPRAKVRQLKCKGDDGIKESKAGEKTTLNISSSINYESKNSGIFLV